MSATRYTGMRALLAGVDLELSGEQRQLQELCRDFTREAVAPHAEEWNLAHAFPSDVFQQMGELGLCGPLVPPEYGGAGAGPGWGGGGRGGRGAGGPARGARRGGPRAHRTPPL